MCSTAARPSATAAVGPTGATTQHPRPIAVSASVNRSSRGCDLNRKPGVALIVNAGMTRPASTLSIRTISPRPACSADIGARSRTPRAARWNTPLAAASSNRNSISGRLRRLPARSSTAVSRPATPGSSSMSSVAYTG